MTTLKGICAAGWLKGSGATTQIYHDLRQAGERQRPGDERDGEVTTLIAVNVIHATLALALGLGAALRERLITGTRT